MLHLRVETPGLATAEARVSGPEAIVGRESGLAVSVADRAMSRRHARFFHSESGWKVEDLGSHNGTLLNGARLTEARPVEVGDVLSLGGTSCTVLAIDVDPRRASSAGGEAPSTFSDGAVLRPASAVLAAAREPEPPRGERPDHRYAERLRILNQVHEALGRSLEVGELLELILDGVFRHLRPQQGAIYLREEGGEPACVAKRGVSPGQEVLRSQHLYAEVAEKGMAALVLDTTEDERFHAAESLLAAGVRSLVAAPLLDPEGSLGMILLASSVAVRQFDEEDLQLLVSLASVAAMRLRNLRLAEAEAERKLLAQEVALARQIQIALLPHELPVVPGYVVHGTTVPSRGVSGDFWEAFRRAADDALILYVVDVSGKGIAASLLTAAVEALSAAPIESGMAPDQVCAAVCRLLHARTPQEKYATAFLAALDPGTGRLRYCNAGHNAALVARADGECEWLDATGLPLGLLPAVPYRLGEIALAPGDLLVLYSDGITEAAAPDGEEYGKDRLAAVVCDHRSMGPTELAEAVESDLDAFAAGTPYLDDRTLVTVRREA